MFHTSRETATRTTTRLIAAMDRRQPVTLTYTKVDGTHTTATLAHPGLTVVPLTALAAIDQLADALAA